MKDKTIGTLTCVTIILGFAMWVCITLAYVMS